jgi:Lrp/AsnC family transcriptional regulator, leucine-responsive regulatory protein
MSPRRCAIAYAAPTKSESAVTKTSRDDGPSQKTDEIDKKILEAMLYNARISNASLAKMVGLSESATLERVRRLEKNKVILGYSTRVDAGAMERNVTALVTIRLVNHSGEVYDEFVRFVKSADEVLSCFQVMGGCDFVAHVAARDVAGLEQFLTQKLLRLKAVERTESMFVLKILKRLFDPPEEHS